MMLAAIVDRGAGVPTKSRYILRINPELIYVNGTWLDRNGDPLVYNPKLGQFGQPYCTHEKGMEEYESFMKVVNE